jgi:hypothetical protein
MLHMYMKIGVKEKAIANIREHRMHVIPYASSREIFHNFNTW